MGITLASPLNIDLLVIDASEYIFGGIKSIGCIDDCLKPVTWHPKPDTELGETMKKALIAVLALLSIATAPIYAAQYRKLSTDTYLDKLKGGWVGQMIGVSYGAPNEFTSGGKIIEQVLPWKPEQVSGALGQDDLYVEMGFLQSIEQYGLSVSAELAGRDFAATKYPLWHANNEGRENIRKGIKPPDSGNPKYNPHCDDIDFQIEADVFGLINPGLPRSSNAICSRFGHIMNYGDGVYGGMFIAAMYTQAFFVGSVQAVLKNALQAVPAESTYAQCINDVVKWYEQDPNDWQKTWRLVQDKWAVRASGRCSKTGESFNIDAKLNGAYVVIGLLYGKGDIQKTLEISNRCGQDSDCNPSSAVGILCTILGYSHIPEEYKSGIPAISDKQFSEVKYSLNSVLPVCLNIARRGIISTGGHTKMIKGKEFLLIPMQNPEPWKLEQ